MSAIVPVSEPDVVVIADDDDDDVVEMSTVKSAPKTSQSSAIVAVATPVVSKPVPVAEDDGVETDQEAESDKEEGWEDAPVGDEKSSKASSSKESDAEEDGDKKSSDENGTNASDSDDDKDDDAPADVTPPASPDSKPSKSSTSTNATAGKPKVVTEDRMAKLAAIKKTAFKMPPRAKAKSDSSSSSSSASSSKGKVDAKTSSKEDNPKKPKKTEEEKKKEREEKKLQQKEKEAKKREEKRSQEREAKEKQDKEQAAAREANTPAALRYAQEVFRHGRTHRALYPPCVIQLTKVAEGLTLYGYHAEGCGPQIFIPLSTAGLFPKAADFPSSPFGRFGDCLLTGLPATPATPLGSDLAISVTGLSTRIAEWCKYMNKHLPGKKGQKKETSFAKLHKPPYDEFAKFCDELDLHRIKEEEKAFDYIRNTGESLKGYTFPAKFAIQTMFMVTGDNDGEKKKKKNDDKDAPSASPTKKRKQPEPSDSSSSHSSSSSVPAVITSVVQPTNMDVKHSPKQTPNHVDAIAAVTPDGDDDIAPPPAKKSKKSEPVTSSAASVQADEPDE